MLAYEGRFEKRGITLYDYTLDLTPPPVDRGAVPIVPVSAFSGRVLEVPAGDEPLALAATHFVECIRHGVEPLTSGARSLRVVEVLEQGDRGATRGGVA